MNTLFLVLAAAGFAADWMVGPVSEPKGEVDIKNCLAEPATWNEKTGALGGKIVRHQDAAKGTAKDGVYNCWYKKSVEVPNEWKGKSVRFEADLSWCDLVIFVNGKKAGVAYDPDGSVELADFLKYGKTNEIKVFATNRGWGTGEHGIKYWGRGDYGPHSANANHFRSEPKLVVRSSAYVDDVYARAVFAWGSDTRGSDTRGSDIPVASNKEGKSSISGRETASPETASSGAASPETASPLELDVDIEVVSLEKMTAEIEVRIFDDIGTGKDLATPGPMPVKTFTQKAKIAKGHNTVKCVIPWADAIPWELVPNAKCYVMDVSMKDCDSRKAPFLFGFREVKRVGKEIYLNGHLQRFRGFWQQGQPKVCSDLHKYGYNLAFEEHKHWAMYDEDEKAKNEQARAGIAVYSGMPSIYFVHDEIRKDPDCTAQWKRFATHYWRIARNMPSVVASSCGVNQICPERNMRPEILGQDPEKGGVVDNINFAADFCRTLHPNCLYFSHADGTEADLSTSNLYFNFTPLQEREEWLSAWSENGTLPWAPVEFGAPYYACWFHSRTPQMTEWLATYYGEEAYAAESPEMLYYNKAFAKDCLSKTHGGWVNNWNDQLFSFNSLGRPFSSKLVYRTNRAWRTFGQNGGIMYLEGWKWDEPNEIRERQIQANGDLVTWLAGDEKITDRTHAFYAGEKITRQLVAVWDGFGEKKVTADWKFVEKDGGKVIASGKEIFVVKQGEVAKKPVMVVAPNVKTLTKYRFEVKFSSDIDRELDHTFATVENDSFNVEVYPQWRSDTWGSDIPVAFNKEDKFSISGRETASPETASPKIVALYDPEGETAKTLTSLGVAFKKYDTLEAAIADKTITHLVVGRRALAHACGLEQAATRIAEGLKVLVMPQTADIWQIMGFQVEDMMPREMHNVELPGLDDTALAYWRGLPMWEKDYGLVMKHDTRRGPRWMHTHAVAGLAFLIPQRAGFVPLVRGEFDLSYTTLLKCVRGKGAAYFCSFDFDGRVGPSGCPAATATASAMMREFLHGSNTRGSDTRGSDTWGSDIPVAFDKEGKSSTSGQETASPLLRIYTDGDEAVRLAQTLGLDAEQFAGKKTDDALIIVGSDAKSDYAAICKALGKNAYAYIFANTNLALQAGLNPTPAKMKISPKQQFKENKNVFWRPVEKEDDIFIVRDRTNWDAFPFAGVGPQHLRFRDRLSACKYEPTGAFKTTGNGLFATDGKVLFDAIDPYQICDRYRKEKDGQAAVIKAGGWGKVPAGERDLYLRTTAQSEDNQMRRLSIVFANLGVGAGKDVLARALYTKPVEAYEPLAQFNVLGPWPSKNDDSAYMVDTTDFPVEPDSDNKGSVAEEMAIAGDVQPNPRFRPLGLTYLDSTPHDLRFLDWRPVVKPDENGLTDLRKLELVAAQSFNTCYCVGFLERETDGEITLRFGVDWRGAVWVNGKEILRTHGGTKDEGSIIKTGIPVHKGQNVITVKAGSGQSASTFYLRVSKEMKPGDVRRTQVKELDEVKLYQTPNPDFDPYEYVYW